MDIQVILKDLGIDWQILAFNIINFCVVLFLLRKFFFGKIMSTMQARQDQINEVLSQKDQAKEILENAKAKSENLMTSARKEANQVVEGANDKSTQIVSAASVKAEKEAQDILNRGEAELKLKEAAMQKEITNKVSELVTMASGKVIRKEVSPDSAKRAVDELVVND